jgi:hypothetical protein
MKTIGKPKRKPVRIIGKPKRRNRAKPKSSKAAKPRNRSTVGKKVGAQRLAEGGTIKRVGKLAKVADEMFCQFCLKRPSPTKAYFDSHEGITMASAAVGASRLLRKVKIVGRIATLLEESADETIMSKREAMRILTEQARGNMFDYVEVDKDGVTILKIDEKTPNLRAIKKLKAKATWRRHARLGQTVGME